MGASVVSTRIAWVAGEGSMLGGAAEIAGCGALGFCLSTSATETTGDTCHDDSSDDSDRRERRK